MKSFSIQTFGCRTNQAEAFYWAGKFQDQGLCLKEDPFQSDVVIVNTCTITQRADSDVRNFIRRVSRKNSKARVIVTGCYAEREPFRFEKDPHVWKVFLNSEKEHLQREVIENFGEKKSPSFRPFRSRAPVKIQDGCNFNCTFCIIPRVRGPSKSLSQEEIINQVKELAAKGFEEIVLTGIHLCLYGRDLSPPTTLRDLISELISIKGLKYIRLSSLDPRFLDRDFIDFVASRKKICPHFHFSLQHASDRVIKKMGRKVSSKKYAELLEYTRKKSPEASLGADIMVGFPGESEQDFEELCAFLKDSPLTYFHVFSYSPRPGTAAFREKRVDTKTEKNRSAALRKLSKEKNLEFRKRFEGRVLDAVMVKQRNSRLQVLTPNYLKVIVPSRSSGKKKVIKVKITEVTPEKTLGLEID